MATAPARKRAKTTPPPETAAALTPNAKNPRLPWKDDKQSDAFAKSLAEFGDLSGVVFNLATGRLVGGHKRVEAFKASGNPDITRTHELASPDASGTVAYGFAVLESGVRFSYREVSWPESKESAALLAANKWGAEWDFDSLPDMLTDLKADDFDMSVVGFSDHELKHLLAQSDEAGSAEERVASVSASKSGEVSVDDTADGVTCPRCKLHFLPK
jgi:hypothetical protein